MTIAAGKLDSEQVSTARRWAMLAASTCAQAACAVVIHGPAFLIPVLHDERGMSLAGAGALAAAPTIGVMLTLVLWGLVVDRRGERFVLITGLVGTTALGVASTQVDSILVLAATLFLGGAFAASANSASGRVVVGWFPPERRGLAMGIRQMAQPVGVGVAAISIAVVADQHGVATALWIPTIATALAAVAVLTVVLDPPRPDRTRVAAPNPYREDSFLPRVHGVSVLLVIPQFLVWTYALVWLVQDLDWSPAAAGALVASAQIAGAVGRILAGQLSDMVGSRMTPLRWVAIAAAVSMLLLGLSASVESPIAAWLMVAATAITVADNGLAFTAVAERAGPFWSGRALGAQNTAQFLAASAVPPVAGLAVTQWGYPAIFAASAVFPLIATVLVPVRDE
ncbi:MAG: MFS transporter, partial [Nocardioides sp.]|nr:MFS transporter [Nocardioides sp.]